MSLTVLSFQLVASLCLCLIGHFSHASSSQSCKDYLASAMNSQLALSSKGSSTPLIPKVSSTKPYRDAGLAALIHITSVENVIGIIKNGSMTSMAYRRFRKTVLGLDGKPIKFDTISGQGDQQFNMNFFSPHLKAERNSKANFPTIVMSPELLQRGDFFYNRTWNFGEFDPAGTTGVRTILPHEFIQALKRGHIKSEGEVVIGPASVDLAESLLEIIIPPSDKDHFLKLAKVNGIELTNLPLRIRFADRLGDYSTEKLPSPPKPIEISASHKNTIDDANAAHQLIHQMNQKDFLLFLRTSKLNPMEEAVSIDRVLAIAQKIRSAPKYFQLIQYLEDTKFPKFIVNQMITTGFARAFTDLEAHRKVVIPVLFNRYMNDEHNWSIRSTDYPPIAFIKDRLPDELLPVAVNRVFVDRPSYLECIRLLKNLLTPEQMKIFVSLAVEKTMQEQNKQMSGKVLEAISLIAPEIFSRAAHLTSILRQAQAVSQDEFARTALEVERTVLYFKPSLDYPQFTPDHLLELMRGLFEMPASAPSSILELRLISHLHGVGITGLSGYARNTVLRLIEVAKSDWSFRQIYGAPNQQLISILMQVLLQDSAASAEARSAAIDIFFSSGKCKESVLVEVIGRTGLISNPNEVERVKALVSTHPTIKARIKDYPGLFAPRALDAVLGNPDDNTENSPLGL